MREYDARNGNADASCACTAATRPRVNAGHELPVRVAPFFAFGGGKLRGHISREFVRETVAGFGVNKVFEGEPDSWLDQLIGRFEFSFTPKKKFATPTLGDCIKKDEYQFAFITEKYHKFSSSFRCVCLRRA